jgi:sortase A
VVAIAMTALGGLALAFVGYLLVFTNLQGDRAQHRLQHEFAVGSPALNGQIPPEGQPVAILRIPSLGLTQAVVEGTTARDLESGPGLLPGSALPGTAGNTVIAGRRLLFGHPFANLDRLRPGDVITVVGGLGRFDYRVSRVVAVVAGRPDPITPSTTARLTLVTANGSSPGSGRFAVLAQLMGKPAGATAPARTEPPASELGLAGEPAAALPSVLWGELLVLAVVATALAYRRSRQPLATYLLSTPVMVALMVAFFQNLVRLLPGTM